MKKFLAQFYEANKPELEIVAILLIILALFLNITVNDSWLLSKSVEQLRFFLVLVSCVLILHLVWDALRTFVELFFTQSSHSTSSDSKQVVSTMFVLLASFLFVLNLLFYMVLSYPREFTFIFITTICYILCKYGIERYEKELKLQYVTVPIFLILLFGIPITSYLFVYFDWDLTRSSIILASIINIVSSLIPVAIFTYKEKKRPPFLKS